VSFSQRSWFPPAPAEEPDPEGLIDLTESNPTRCGLEVPVSLPIVTHYQPEPLGLGPARDAVARWLGPKVTADQVVLCASTSEAYGWLFKLLCDGGDEVLLAQPGYPLFEHLGALEGVAVKGFGLRFDGQWVLDLDRVVEAAGPRTKAVVVVSPGNPTGAYLRPEDFDALDALCAARGWALVVDEVFAEPERSLAGRSTRALGFFLGGLSKAAGLPQHKLSWLIATGPGAPRAEALRRLDFIADCYLSVAAPVQQALPELLERSAAFRRAASARCAQNRGVLAALRPVGAAWELLPAEAGWVAVLRVPEQPPEPERVRGLLRAGVKVHPGYFYDFHAGAHLVLSLLPEPAPFLAGATRLARLLG
jgi:aspartate/methionine/tyrosine aminotransferase